MKKYLSVLILSILIIPYVALASWWNPFSWNMFSFLHKKEVTPQVEVQKTPEEKINELQKQLDELKGKSLVPASSELIPEVKKTQTVDSSVKMIKPIQTLDVCLNIEGVQAKTPEGYSWASGNICSKIVSIDYCLNISGVQSKIPDGMFIYGISKECLTQNEIKYIADKMAEEKNKEMLEEIKSTAPIYSRECEDAQDKYKRLTERMYNMKDISEAATFAITEVNPAGNQVDYACQLNMPLKTLEPMKSTNCYVNYYGSSASVSCYGN